MVDATVMIFEGSTCQSRPIWIHIHHGNSYIYIWGSKKGTLTGICKSISSIPSLSRQGGRSRPTDLLSKNGRPNFIQMEGTDKILIVGVQHD